VGFIQGTHRQPQFTRHIDTADLQALFAKGEAVESLMSHPGWAHVREVIEAEIDTIDRRLDTGAVSGSPPSRSEYAAAHGRRGGLRAVIDAPQAILLVSETELARQRARHEDPGESGIGG
jgi:hypothetical protein